MEGRTILDTETLASVPPEGIADNLGAKPSPDGTKIAVFAGLRDKGKPLTLYLYDRQGRRIKELQTALYPEISDDGFGPVPVDFSWLDDESLVLESWRQPWEGCDLYLLNTATGAASKLAENARSPAVSLDDGRIAAIPMTAGDPPSWPNKVGIYDRTGKLLSICSPDVPGIYISGMEWGAGGSKLLIHASFLVDNRVDRNGLIIWDTSEGRVVETIYNPEGTFDVGVMKDLSAIFVMDY